MTKSRKPAAITFPVTFRTTHQVVRTNAETGVEIRSDGADGYSVWRPVGRNHELSYYGGKRNLAEAREVATYYAEDAREQVAMDHADALEMDAAETARVVAEIVAAVEQAEARAAGCPAARAVKALLYGARISAEATYPHIWAAGRRRLARAQRILSGEEPIQSDAQADAEVEAFNRRNPAGTRVELTTVERYGLRGTITERPASIFAEDNRAAVMVKVDGKGYRIEWCDSLRPLVGRDRP